MVHRVITAADNKQRTAVGYTEDLRCGNCIKARGTGTPRTNLYCTLHRIPVRKNGLCAIEAKRYGEKKCHPE